MDDPYPSSRSTSPDIMEYYNSIMHGTSPFKTSSDTDEHPTCNAEARGTSEGGQNLITAVQSANWSKCSLDINGSPTYRNSQCESRDQVDILAELRNASTSIPSSWWPKVDRVLALFQQNAPDHCIVLARTYLTVSDVPRLVKLFFYLVITWATNDYHVAQHHLDILTGSIVILEHCDTLDEQERYLLSLFREDIKTLKTRQGQWQLEGMQDGMQDHHERAASASMEQQEHVGSDETTAVDLTFASDRVCETIQEADDNIDEDNAECLELALAMPSSPPLPMRSALRNKSSMLSILTPMIKLHTIEDGGWERNQFPSLKMRHSLRYVVKKLLRRT